MSKLNKGENLTGKYQLLIDSATDLLQEGFVVSQEGSKLLIKGKTASIDVKNKLWDLYSQLNPNYISDDVDIDVRVSTVVTGTPSKFSKQGDDVALLRKGPGTALAVVAELTENEELELLGRVNDNWWLVRTLRGEEGYCYAQHLHILD